MDSTQINTNTSPASAAPAAWFEISDPAQLPVKPTVSVLMLAYRHAAYLADAIDGVLMQRADFPIELLIAEDCSPDATLSIAKSYQKRNPSLIRIITSDNNVGISANFRRVFEASRGDLIALCEGDDYWTDPHKLQKQVSFLKNNPEFAACAHQAWVTYTDRNIERHLFREGVSKDLTMINFIAGRPFHTASLLFKSEYLKTAPLPLNITSGDRALFMLCAAFGSIRFIDEPMCVYRKSSVGVSSWVTVEMLRKDLAIAPWMASIYPAFPSSRCLSFVHKTIIDYPERISIRILVKHYILFVIYSMSYFPKNLHDVVRFTMINLPKIIKKSLQFNDK